MILITYLILIIIIKFDYVLSNNEYNHTILFISGWPQSGTSLLLQLLTLSPGISTMVKKCNEKKRCENTNFEGQWLLGTKSQQASSILNAGSMCKYNNNSLNNINEYIRQHFYQEWSKFWEFNNNYILVEKSPQSMLKIPLMNTIFNKKMNKFLIVMKHPITLNVALPKEMEWLYHYNSKKKISSNIVPNTIQQVEYNFRYFLNFMTHKSNQTGLRSCTIGWLEAMETLYSMLINKDKSNNEYISNDTVRIIRYEEFKNPQILCINIMKFVYLDNNYIITDNIKFQMYTEAIENVCNKFLSKQNFQKVNSKNVQQDINRRSLRLNNHNIEDITNKIAFNPDIMYNSIVKRTKGFETARKMINEVKGYEDIEKSLQLIEKRLIKFGYGLDFHSLFGYKNNKYENVFENFELKIK